MQAALTDTLAFAAPGLVHRFGNAVFTIQGHAQILDGDGPHEPKRHAILAAAERAAATLLVMRSLIGPVGDPPQGAVSLFGAIVDILRVPVREAGHLLECTSDPAADRPVDGGMFCPGIIDAVRQFVGLLPAGCAGTIGIRLSDSGTGGVGLTIAFRARAGTLPFPLPLAELVRRLAGALHPSGDRLPWREQSAGIAVVFPCSASRRTWNAAEA